MWLYRLSRFPHSVDDYGYRSEETPNLLERLGKKCTEITFITGAVYDQACGADRVTNRLIALISFSLTAVVKNFLDLVLKVFG